MSVYYQGGEGQDRGVAPGREPLVLLVDGLRIYVLFGPIKLFGRSWTCYVT